MRSHFSALSYKNDNNRKTHVESTRAMARERGSRSEAKNCEILLFRAADRRFDRKFKCPTGRASFWVKFPTVRSLTRVKCPGVMGGFGIDWYIIAEIMDINCLEHSVSGSTRSSSKLVPSCSHRFTPFYFV